jgi:hypothetical protein
MSGELDFKIGNDEDSARRAFRAKVPGLKVLLRDRGEIRDVMDISSMGLAFKDDTKTFHEGDSVLFDLLLNDKPFLVELKAVVMRVLDKGLVGVNFEIDDHHKEIRLDKLVLEIQKRMIAMRKMARE